MGPFFRSLQFRISIIYILISVLTIAVTGSALYAGISRVVMHESVESSQMAVSKGGTYVEMYLDRLKVLSSVLAGNPQTIRTLASKDKAGEQDVLKMIDNVLAADPYIQSVIVIGQDGYVLSNERKLNMMRSSDMMKESWYVAAIHSSNPVLTSARMQKFSMDKNNWVISMSQEIRGKDGSNLGVVLLDIKYKGLEAYLNDLDLGKDGYTYIVNSRNEIVYHKDVSYFVDEAKKNQLIEMNRQNPGYDAKRDRLVYQTDLKGSDWTLVGVSSLDGLQQIRAQLLRSFIMVGTVLLLFILLAIPWIARSMTQPVRRLEQAMQKVQSGQLAISVPETGVTEVQGLARHFNSMIMEIRQLLQDIETKEGALRLHELSVLHSQINPHFLYNTLDTIVWMAEFQDTDRVISTTKALAEFFQLSLSGGSEFTTIAKEMAHVEQYLFIQRERYGEKLSYTISYDPALADVVIPKIILQPLAENAVYHGIREKEGPGRLEIFCGRADDGTIRLIVKDDGAGFNPAVLQAPPAAAGGGGSAGDKSKLGGVGIHNVDERIKLYYGDRYGIKLSSAPGAGTVVNISIPLAITSHEGEKLT
ncbi:sensor histidine kinase [Paenibacillus doosanensis]|uniref:sensor histidine kinase n=1 Tax=Paenibacillus doosanensis TaxID=1229154 RepID=UPI00217F71FA|nr:sensor histidine kinase [Paenibacillus doosanensis]MCS7460473.1 sensor histidine kinase [Paenibacillus doosanensis]